MYRQIIEKHKLIFLDEEHHTYSLLNSDIQFISVTEFIGTFFDNFNEEEVAKKLIKTKKYSNKTVEEILNEWKSRRDRGTIVHKQIEDFLLNNKHSDLLMELDLKAQKGIDFLKTKCIKHQNHLFPEVRVCSEKLKLAGTIDLLIYNQKNKKFSIIDWKTNLEIKKNGFKKGITHPLLSIDDCSFNKYSLQLSIYKEILEKEFNIEVAGTYIIHLKENAYELMKCEINQLLVLEMLESREKLI
ncbi:MAG: hypothetical protein CMP65_03165 [Flavobacteriales bacterium]|nr:hypothetical protein [Flavobacteriales bacterium]|tara:strand:+ start:277 stop:1005 length:729 start_codon:yes stop_codon:yes gene_type:complete